MNENIKTNTLTKTSPQHEMSPPSNKSSIHLDMFFRETVLKFKNENIDEFRAITLMNLSFLLDMNDDILSKLLLSSHHSKPFPLKLSTASNSFNLNMTLGYWLSKRLKLRKDDRMFGSSSVQPSHLQAIHPLAVFLYRDENVRTEGMFRKSGNTERQGELIEWLERCNMLLITNNSNTSHFHKTNNKSSTNKNKDKASNIYINNTDTKFHPNTDATATTYSTHDKENNCNGDNKKRKQEYSTVDGYYKNKKKDKKHFEIKSLNDHLNENPICKIDQNNQNEIHNENTIQNNNKNSSNNKNYNFKSPNNITAGELSNSLFSVHDITSVFKKYLIELNEPLTLNCYFSVIKKIADLKDETSQVNAIRLIIQLLPKPNIKMLNKLLNLLNKIHYNADLNKMDKNNLAVIFTPTIFFPKNLPAEEFQEATAKLQPLTASMIIYCNQICQYPLVYGIDILNRIEDLKEAEGDAQKENTKSLKNKITTYWKKRMKQVEMEGECGVAMRSSITFNDRHFSNSQQNQLFTEKELLKLLNTLDSKTKEGRENVIKICKTMDLRSSNRTTLVRETSMGVFGSSKLGSSVAKLVSSGRKVDLMGSQSKKLPRQLEPVRLLLRSHFEDESCCGVTRDNDDTKINCIYCGEGKHDYIESNKKSDTKKNSIKVDKIKEKCLNLENNSISLSPKLPRYNLRVKKLQTIEKKKDEDRDSAYVEEDNEEDNEWDNEGYCGEVKSNNNVDTLFGNYEICQRDDGETDEEYDLLSVLKGCKFDETIYENDDYYDESGDDESLN